MLNNLLNEQLAHNIIQFICPRPTLSPSSVFEPPSVLKQAQAEGVIHLGTFSYAVSGFFLYRNRPLLFIWRASSNWTSKSSS